MSLYPPHIVIAQLPLFPFYPCLHFHSQHITQTIHSGTWGSWGSLFTRVVGAVGVEAFWDPRTPPTSETQTYHDISDCSGKYNLFARVVGAVGVEAFWNPLIFEARTYRGISTCWEEYILFTRVVGAVGVEAFWDPRTPGTSQRQTYHI